jgi:purine-binding chemotaxis protein CheW
MEEKRQFASFFVEDLLFGIGVEAVQEVTASEDLTRVPLAPRNVAGLINLRGQIVTAIDLRSCLFPIEPTATRASVNVILHADNGYISLLVDRVGDIVEVSDDSFELSPETLREPGRKLIPGVYKLNKRLLHVLDLEQALKTGNMHQGSR